MVHLRRESQSPDRDAALPVASDAPRSVAPRRRSSASPFAVGTGRTSSHASSDPPRRDCIPGFPIPLSPSIRENSPPRDGSAVATERRRRLRLTKQCFLQMERHKSTLFAMVAPSNGLSAGAHTARCGPLLVSGRVLVSIPTKIPTLRRDTPTSYETQWESKTLRIQGFSAL